MKKVSIFLVLAFSLIVTKCKKKESESKVKKTTKIVDKILTDEEYLKNFFVSNEDKIDRAFFRKEVYPRIESAWTKQPQKFNILRKVSYKASRSTEDTVFNAQLKDIKAMIVRL